LKDSKLKTQNFKLPILVGPTGVGKSEVACYLALRLKAEILSADTFQVFRGMAVGTAQPSPEWQKKVVHHLVGVKSPAEPWSAGLFAREAGSILEKKREEGQRMLVVGGAGFYVRALVEGVPEGEASTKEVRELVGKKMGELGEAKAYDWLRERDISAAERIHPNDLFRVQRALEKTFSGPASPSTVTSQGTSNVFFIGLERSRENLDKILKSRSRSMWEGGLQKEAQWLLDLGIKDTAPVFKAIGYQEVFDFLGARITEEEAVEKIFRRTRQYAKRQWTWFKHQHEVHWVNLDLYPGPSEAAEALEQILRKIEG
jgi:tRNA dimethylallyltransferase